MTKKCNSKINVSQTLLIKVMLCLWKQYVSNRTGATKAYMASPTDMKYTLLVNELNGIGHLLNSNEAILALNEYKPECLAEEDAPEPKPTFVDISVAYMNNVLAYQYSDPSNNTFIPSSKLSDNSKIITKLNTNECLTEAYALYPKISSDPDDMSKPWITSANVGERTGCCGTSNTGFIFMTIEVDINNFPFNGCEDLSLNCFEH